MAYRQYFPALSVAQGGRPYSIAEFATDKDENPGQYSTSFSPEGDLELGQTRYRSPRQDEMERWDRTDNAETHTEHRPISSGHGSGSRSFKGTRDVDNDS